MITALVTALLGATGPCSDLPMLPGTTWTYRTQVSWTLENSATVRDTTFAWTVKVLASLHRDSSIVATVENWPTALAWWAPGQAPDTSLIVCHNNRVYHGLELTDDDLLFVFPLHEGALYAQDPPDRTDNMYGWYVEQAVRMPEALVRLGANRQDSLYTVVYRTNPDHQIFDFAPGLGVSRYVYGHHGTVATAIATLVSAHISH